MEVSMPRHRTQDLSAINMSPSVQARPQQRNLSGLHSYQSVTPQRTALDNKGDHLHHQQRDHRHQKYYPAIDAGSDNRPIDAATDHRVIFERKRSPTRIQGFSVDGNKKALRDGRSAAHVAPSFAAYSPQHGSAGVSPVVVRSMPPLNYGGGPTISSSSSSRSMMAAPLTASSTRGGGAPSSIFLGGAEGRADPFQRETGNDNRSVFAAEEARQRALQQEHVPGDDASAVDDADYFTYQATAADGDDDDGQGVVVGFAVANTSHFERIPDIYTRGFGGGNTTASSMASMVHDGNPNTTVKRLIANKLALGGAVGAVDPFFDLTPSQDQPRRHNNNASSNSMVVMGELPRDPLLLIASLMESQGLNIIDTRHISDKMNDTSAAVVVGNANVYDSVNLEMAMHHRQSDQFLLDLDRAIRKGDYFTRYHLLRRTDRSGPDPVERFIKIELEDPSPSFLAQIDPTRTFPIAYLAVKPCSSSSAATISRHKLSNLVGITRDCSNPAFGPHRIFVDRSIGYGGVMWEDPPSCPDPDNCTAQQVEVYKAKQLQFLRILKEKCVGMQGKRYATTGKCQLLHAENAFTLWFFDANRNAAEQVVFCGHTASTTDFWVDVFKGIIAVNSSRRVPVPVPTPYNYGGTIGRAAAELEAYRSMADVQFHHNNSRNMADANNRSSGVSYSARAAKDDYVGDATPPPAAGNDKPPPTSAAVGGNSAGGVNGLNDATPSPSSLTPSAQRREDERGNHPSASSGVASPSHAPQKDTAIESANRRNDKERAEQRTCEERRQVKIFQQNEETMMSPFFIPRQIGVNSQGEAIGEDGLTNAERNHLRRQKPPMSHLFRKARFLIDLRNATTPSSYF